MPDNGTSATSNHSIGTRGGAPIEAPAGPTPICLNTNELVTNIETRSRSLLAY